MNKIGYKIHSTCLELVTYTKIYFIPLQDLSNARFTISNPWFGNSIRLRIKKKDIDIMVIIPYTVNKFTENITILKQMILEIQGVNKS